MNRQFRRAKATGDEERREIEVLRCEDHPESWTHEATYLLRIAKVDSASYAVLGSRL
jgi:hypothetical protein